MINHLALFKLNPEVDEEKVEWMMRETRIRLLKIPVVLGLRCGKSIETGLEWPFFVAIEVETREKLTLYREDPNHLGFVTDVLEPNITARLDLDYEMEPGKDVLYS